MIAPKKWHGHEIKLCHWTVPETEWEIAHLKPLSMTDEDKEFLTMLDERAEEVANKHEGMNNVIVYSPFRIKVDDSGRCWLWSYKTCGNDDIERTIICHLRI